MSHYCAAVFHKEGQSVEELMAPYGSGYKVAPYVWLNRKEAVAFARKYCETEGKTDEECWQMVSDGLMTDEDGNIYIDRNPYVEWDDWCVGGRWSDILALKNGERTSSGRVRDIDFDLGYKKLYEESLHFWDVVVEHVPARPGEEYETLRDKKYFRDRYGDRESYAEEIARFYTFAVVTPDGKWHDPYELEQSRDPFTWGEAERIWAARYKDRFLDTADKDWLLTICDYHF